MMWVFYLIIAYIISWFITFVATRFSDDIMELLNEGHIFWLLIPYLSIIPSGVFLVVAINGWIEYGDGEDLLEKFNEWLFIKKEDV